MKIAVLRALQLGDLLVAVPALRALRAGYPGAEITLIGLPWLDMFVARFSHYVDRPLALPGYPGLMERPYVAGRTEQFLASQCAYGYDLVVQLHGSGQISNRLALELGGRSTVGYFDTECPPGMTGAPYAHHLHEVERNLHLAVLAGGEPRGVHLEFPLFPEDRRAASSLLPTGRLVGLHPGSRSPARRWPVRSFALLGDLLAAEGFRVVITGGPDEREVAREVTLAMDAPAINLAGETSLGVLAACIERFDLFVSNDTGPAHIAAALDTPSVTLFGPADPHRWAPLDAIRHPIARLPLPCSPCNRSVCPIDHACMKLLEPHTVAKAALNLVKKEVAACR